MPRAYAGSPPVPRSRRRRRRPDAGCRAGGPSRPGSRHARRRRLHRRAGARARPAGPPARQDPSGGGRRDAEAEGQRAGRRAGAAWRRPRSRRSRRPAAASARPCLPGQPSHRRSRRARSCAGSRGPRPSPPRRAPRPAPPMRADQPPQDGSLVQLVARPRSRSMPRTARATPPPPMTGSPDDRRVSGHRLRKRSRTAHQAKLAARRMPTATRRAGRRPSAGERAQRLDHPDRRDRQPDGRQEAAGQGALDRTSRPRSAEPFTESVERNGSTLWRARFAGFERSAPGPGGLRSSEVEGICHAWRPGSRRAAVRVACVRVRVAWREFSYGVREEGPWLR